VTTEKFFKFSNKDNYVQGHSKSNGL